MKVEILEETGTAECSFGQVKWNLGWWKGTGLLGSRWRRWFWDLEGDGEFPRGLHGFPPLQGLFSWRPTGWGADGVLQGLWEARSDCVPPGRD